MTLRQKFSMFEVDALLSYFLSYKSIGRRWMPTSVLTFWEYHVLYVYFFNFLISSAAEVKSAGFDIKKHTCNEITIFFFLNSGLGLMSNLMQNSQMAKEIKRHAVGQFI